MLIFLFSVFVVGVYAFANRIAGSDYWKDKMGDLGSRTTGYAVASLGTGLLAWSTGAFNVWASLGITVFSLVVWILTRNRSPRGVFFLLTGGRIGAVDANGNVTKWFDGDHSKPTEWIAERTSSVVWMTALYSHNKELLVRYAWHYGFWHLLLVLLPSSLIFSAATFAYAPVLALLGLLWPVFHWVAGTMGPRGVESHAREIAEWLTGGFIYGLFFVLTVLGGAYIAPGWIY